MTEPDQAEWFKAQPVETQAAFMTVFMASRIGKACYLAPQDTMIVAAGLARIAGFSPADVLPLQVVRQLRREGLVT